MSSPAHSSDEEEEGPKKAHIHACLLEFLANVEVDHTVEAFIAHWDHLALNACRSHVSQVGHGVCPSPGDIKRFLSQSRHFHTAATHHIAFLPDLPTIPVHNVCGVVLLKDPPVTIKGPVERYCLLPEGHSQRPSCVGTDGWTAEFDLVVDEATHSEGAIYGVFAEAVVQRAAMRTSGAVFVQGRAPLFERVLQRSLTTLFTHRPLCHRQYIIHWAHLRYAVIPPLHASDTGTTTASTPDAMFVLCDDLDQRVMHFPLQALNASNATTLHWRSATSKANVLQGHRLLVQQRRQNACALHQADSTFQTLVGSHPSHTAVVVRVLSRPAECDGSFRTSHLVLGEARGLEALALQHMFPCATNTCWLLAVRDGRCPETDQQLLQACQVKAALLPLAVRLQGQMLPAVDAEELAEEKLLRSPSPCRPRISFSAQPLRRGSGYNAAQCRRPGKAVRPTSLLRAPCRTLRPLQLFRDDQEAG